MDTDTMRDKARKRYDVGWIDPRAMDTDTRRAPRERYAFGWTHPMSLTWGFSKPLDDEEPKPKEHSFAAKAGYIIIAVVYLAGCWLRDLTNDEDNNT